MRPGLEILKILNFARLEKATYVDYQSYPIEHDNEFWVVLPETVNVAYVHLH